MEDQKILNEAEFAKVTGGGSSTRPSSYASCPTCGTSEYLEVVNRVYVSSLKKTIYSYRCTACGETFTHAN